MTPARRLILKLLLAAEDEVTSARGLVRGCGLLGASENSTRIALARLSAAGMIESAGRGLYRLGPRALGLARDVARWRSGEARVRPWGGDWLLVHTGALGRSDRAALRQRERALALLGLRELERGLYLRADNLSEPLEQVRLRLRALGLAPEALICRAADLDAAHAERARTLWPAENLQQGYRAQTERMTQWATQADALDAEDAAREAYQIGDAAIRQLVFDPLLPDQWIDTGLRARFTEATLQFDALGHAIWQRLSVQPVDRIAPAQIRLQ